MSQWQYHAAKSLIKKYAQIQEKSIKLRDKLLDCKMKAKEVHIFSGLNVSKEIDTLSQDALYIYELSESVNEILKEDIGTNPKIPPNLKKLFLELKSNAERTNKLIQSNLDRSQAIKDYLVNKSFLVYLVNACTNLIDVINRSFVQVIRFTLVFPSKLLPKKKREVLGKRLNATNQKQIAERKWHD